MAIISFALALVGAPALPVVQSKIVAASLFKNGYAVVTREIDIPAGGKALIEAIPQGALGTVWVTTTEGLKLASVRNTEVQKANSSPPTSMVELLQSNIGKEVRLDLSESRAIGGTLYSVSPELIVLKSGADVTAIAPNQVRNVTLSGSPKLEVSHESTHRALEIHIEGNKAGRLYLIGLEKGLTWSPAYSLDISNPLKMKFTSKAVLLNDLGEMKDIEARLVTGFPNVYFLPIVDPLLAANTVEEYVKSIGISDASANARAAGFGGGMLNQASGYVPEGQSRSGYDSSDSSIIFGDFSQAMNHDNPSGVEEGDLFFYRQAHMTMSKGDRAYYVLADASLEYKEIYTWDSADTISSDTVYGYERPNQPQPVDEVWHAIRFKDAVGQPLTTGPATTFKNGELMGQDMLHYTSVGGEALVKITKALDVHAESADEEIDRKRNALQVNGSGSFDLVSLKTVLKVTNVKKESVHMKVTRPFTGDLTDDGGAKVTKNVKGLRFINPSGRLVWERDLDGGKTLTLTFTTKVYVRPGR